MTRLQLSALHENLHESARNRCLSEFQPDFRNHGLHKQLFSKDNPVEDIRAAILLREDRGGQNKKCRLRQSALVQVRFLERPEKLLPNRSFARRTVGWQ